MGTVEQYLLQLKIEKRRWRRATAVLTVLSLLVAVGVSWNLRMTGITLVNDACCGYEEHQHTEKCLAKNTLICGCDYEEPLAEHAELSVVESAVEIYIDAEIIPVESIALTPDSEPAEAKTQHIHMDECYQWAYQCGYEEHIHSITCYSNPKADVENQLNWQEMFADYPYTGDLQKDLVGIAKTQVGYVESALNFEVDDDGVRHGYTRYGAWYGAPYNEWSAMFVSFCLKYAGADLSEYPTSSGADTMAGLWNKQGKYAPFGQYVPVSGNLVFFKDNTVGIVAEVQNATIYVIGGDVDDAVSGCILPLNDESIDGWGMIDRPLYEDTLPENILSDDDLFDISEGPVVSIFEGNDALPQMKQYSLRNTQTMTELIAYLEANEGSYFFTLMDFNNVELPKDEQGNYIAQANSDYKLSISFNSPKGFLPGTYQYQIPNGLMVDGGEGTFILKDGTNVGSWVVTDTGLITLVFNENMNSRTDITISVTLGIHFPEQEDPIDFDGKITVTVEKPPQQQFPTKMYKWGVPGSKTGKDGDDPTKIYWTVQVIGQKDSQIPGNILSDQVLFGEWSKDHRYTESDIAGGLTFGVSEPDPMTGEAIDWHSWHVSSDDPHLIWTQTGWSYKIPKTVTCQWCGEVELGNENWIYTVNYTSTPDPIGVAGTYGYENQASIDSQHAYAWTDFTHSEIYGEIVKKGTFVSDANGGAFLWEFQAILPGMKENQKAENHWYIMDNMYLFDNEGYNVGYVENDAHLSMVTANYNGTTIHIPRVQDATADDHFAWDNSWTANNNGIDYGREINLLSRCQCNEDNCQFWETGCSEYWFIRDDGTADTNGYCQCWTEMESVTFTFVYETDDMSLIENYGGFGYKLQNIAELYYKPNGFTESALVSHTQAAVTIPGLFKKELTHDFDGYTANYKVTVNEAKLVLTNGTPLTIHDVMTSTLAYISGSMVITAEDVNGNTTVLQQGRDYTIEYDGTGNQTDQAGNIVHVLDIVILKPQPVMYTLDYDTTLIMPEQVTEAIKYSNSASITLWGETITNDSTEKVYADINIAAKSYKVEMFKTCAQTNNPLSDAVFGLYNAQGGLITTDTTDANGHLLFQTNIIDGIILREHVLYYMQEVQSPPAYQLDNTKHWFVFCNDTGDPCETCKEILGETDAIRIPFEQTGKVHAVNQPACCELPATGGIGITLYVLCGLILISAPLVYGLRLRLKYERRSRE